MSIYKELQLFFLPDLYAQERQFQVLAIQTQGLAYIARDHIETKPEMKQTAVSYSRKQPLLHYCIVL